MLTISMAELEKAVSWLKTNSNRLNVNLRIEGPKLVLSSVDKQDQHVEINLFDIETSLFPKLTKTDTLR